MGVHKEKRPILATEGIQAGETTSPSTFSSPITVSGLLTLSSGLKLASEAVTVSTALQTLSPSGVSFVTVATSGGDRDFKLPAPPARGVVKVVMVDNQTTSVDTVIHTATTSTANTFWGTTFNTASLAAASTGSPGGTPAGTAALLLVGASTAQWAVLPGSTFNWDFAGSTGSSSMT